ncbi:MAG: WD40 repeat domain-containing protein [Alkalispirochaetaceae bacterium]
MAGVTSYISGMETPASATRGFYPIESSSLRSLLKLEEPESFAVGTDSGTVGLWKAGRLALPLDAHRRAVTALATGGGLLATGGLDRLIRVWELPEGVLRYELREHRRGICALAFGLGGVHLVSVGLDGSCRVYAARSGEELFYRTVPRRRLTLLLPLEQTALSGGLSPEVTLWSFPGMEEIATVPTGAPCLYAGLVLSRHKRFLTVDYNQNLILWSPSARPVGSVGMRLNGRTTVACDTSEEAVAVCDGRWVEVYTLPDLELTSRFRHRGRQARAIMVPEADMVAVGDRRGVLSLYGVNRTLT